MLNRYTLLVVLILATSAIASNRLLQNDQGNFNVLERGATLVEQFDQEIRTRISTVVATREQRFQTYNGAMSITESLRAQLLTTADRILELLSHLERLCQDHLTGEVANRFRQAIGKVRQARQKLFDARKICSLALESGYTHRANGHGEGFETIKKIREGFDRCQTYAREEMHGQMAQADVIMRNAWSSAQRERMAQLAQPQTQIQDQGSPSAGIGSVSTNGLAQALAEIKKIPEIQARETEMIQAIQSLQERFERESALAIETQKKVQEFALHTTEMLNEIQQQLGDPSEHDPAAVAKIQAIILERSVYLGFLQSKSVMHNAQALIAQGEVDRMRKIRAQIDNLQGTHQGM